VAWPSRAKCVTGPLPSPQKVSLMGCAAPPLISPGPSHHFSDVGLLSVTLSPTQSYDALVTDGAPCLPRPSEHMAGHRSRVWVGSNTTCHVAITLSPKGRSDGVCSATAYKPRILPSLFRCGTLIRDKWHTRVTCAGLSRLCQIFSTAAPCLGARPCHPLSASRLKFSFGVILEALSIHSTLHSVFSSKTFS